jgi:hypothetical protein
VTDVPGWARRAIEAQGKYAVEEIEERLADVGLDGESAPTGSAGGGEGTARGGEAGRDRLMGGARSNEFQKAIIAMARLYGWRVAHFTAVRTEHGWRVPVAADGKGFPDLILVRDRLVAVEVKGGGNRPTPQQQEWISALRIAGVETYVWTPTEMDDGTVQTILAARGRPDPMALGRLVEA